MDGAPVVLAVALLGLVGDVVPHADVGGGPDVDVGVHIPHPGKLIGGDLLHVLRVGSLDQGALHGVVEDVDKGLAAHGVGLLDQGLHQARLAAVELDQDLLALLPGPRRCGSGTGRIFEYGDLPWCVPHFPFSRCGCPHIRKSGAEDRLPPRVGSVVWYRASRDAWDRCTRVTALTTRMAMTEAGTATMAHWMP